MVNSPFDVAYQKTFCLARPSGRMAPRSLRDTDSARDPGSLVRIQSMSTEPRKRYGDAGRSREVSSGACGSSTPVVLLTMPVDRGKRPDIVTECPGAVSVLA